MLEHSNVEGWCAYVSMMGLLLLMHSFHIRVCGFDMSVFALFIFMFDGLYALNALKEKRIFSKYVLLLSSKLFFFLFFISERLPSLPEYWFSLCSIGYAILKSPIPLNSMFARRVTCTCFDVRKMLDNLKRKRKLFLRPKIC